MPLASGTLLGPYEISTPLGAGGMGEVYRARDTRLERIVAIKVLPSELSTDPVRKQRFEREAKAISILNHPNICTLHDVGHHDGIDYLVMECVEGETLATRLEKSALPLDQVLKYGAQIADALDKAHRHGILHRDLKPGNIMLTPTGAKLLDFGLAKAVAPPADLATLSRAHTQDSPVTQHGAIIGTFQYMSPEQIEGKELDSRSDIFSLGVVLYEMVTGQRAFDGKSQLSVASAILEKEPPSITAIKPLTPLTLEHSIRRCLAKDPDYRWQTARDLALELKWNAEKNSVAAPAAQIPPPSRNRERIFWAVALAASMVAAVLATLYTRPASPRLTVTRSFIKPAAGSSFTFTGTAAGFALSPDGKILAYVAANADGTSVLWLRPLDSLHAQPLADTDNAAYPFWSPDGRFIAFFASGKLKKVEATGGPPVILADASDGRGGAWNAAGDILFTPTVNAGLYRVSSSGGSPTLVTTLDPAKGESTHRWPYFLPDGRHFLFLAGTVFSPTNDPTNSILVGSLDSKETKSIVHTHANAIYSAGRLLFLRQYTLMAQPFDLKRLELTGDAVPVANPVQEGRSVAKAVFSSSDNGTLVYVEGNGANDRRLTWFDRAGKELEVLPDMGSYSGARLSLDGKQLAYYMDSSGYDIWTYDFARRLKTAQTFGTAADQGNLYPVWSPDGRRLIFASYRDRKYSLYQKASDGSGTEELLLAGVNMIRFPSDVSPDGKLLAFQEASASGWAIWMLPLEGDRQPYLFHSSQFAEREPAFSPNGKWLAYCSNESGDYKVYVVPYPGPGGRWQVSPAGGCGPRWRRDGKELFYYSTDNKIMSVAVSVTASSFEFTTARPLFVTRSYGVFSRYDVSADGSKFMIPYEVGEPNASITLILNWNAPLQN
jgi:serine/threonine protein kinase/Tol biopolymer transport system component